MYRKSLWATVLIPFVLLAACSPGPKTDNKNSAGPSGKKQAQGHRQVANLAKTHNAQANWVEWMNSMKDIDEQPFSIEVQKALGPCIGRPTLFTVTFNDIYRDKDGLRLLCFPSYFGPNDWARDHIHLTLDINELNAQKVASDSNSEPLRSNFEKTWDVVAVPTNIDVTHSNVYKPANPSEKSLEGYEMVTDVWITGSFVDAELLPEDDAP